MSIEDRNRIANLEQRVADLETIVSTLAVRPVQVKAAFERAEPARETLKVRRG